MKRWKTIPALLAFCIAVGSLTCQSDIPQGKSMTDSTQVLVEQLSAPDFNQRAIALAALVKQGKKATPALLTVLKSTDVQLRIQAAQGLSEIADTVSADALAQALQDNDDKVRAYAAQGLARMNDSRAIDALVSTINDFPDLLHVPYTLSVYILIESGPSVLPKIAPLLRSPNPMTREHAFLVIRSIVSGLPEAEDWNQLWQSLGSYDPKGVDVSARDRAAHQWANWIEQYVQSLDK